MNKELFLISKTHIVRISIVTITILLIPFVAMQFTSEVSWHLGDFVVAGLLIFGSGYFYKTLTKNSNRIGIKIIIGTIILILFLLIWAVLAVDLV
ncbi:MAG: hypothetical protein ACJAS9_003292 [Polaribacter sp.]|jgi:hypothetical protein